MIYQIKKIQKLNKKLKWRHPWFQKTDVRQIFRPTLAFTKTFLVIL